MLAVVQMMERLTLPGHGGVDGADVRSSSRSSCSSGGGGGDGWRWWWWWWWRPPAAGAQTTAAVPQDNGWTAIMWTTHWGEDGHSLPVLVICLPLTPPPPRLPLVTLCQANSIRTAERATVS